MAPSNKSLRLQLKRLKERNNKIEERKELKRQIFQEKYKAPLTGLRSFGQGLGRVAGGVQSFASSYDKPKKKGRRNSGFDIDSFMNHRI